MKRLLIGFALALQATAGTQWILPHFAYGGGWSTQFLIHNRCTTPLTLSTSFRHADARILRQMSMAVAGRAVVLAELPVPPAQLTTGSWSIDSITGNGGIGDTCLFVMALYSFQPEGGTTFEASTTLANTFARSTPTLVFDNTGGASTGVALATRENQQQTITYNVRDGAGLLVDTGLFILPANGQVSFNLAEQLPATAGKRGTVQFLNADKATFGLSLLGFRFNIGGYFSALPVF